jgi:hypothetical protein
VSRGTVSRGTGTVFWSIALFVVGTLALRASAVSPQTSFAKKKTLVVWGGDMHEPKQCVDLFVPWLTEQGFEVEVSPSLPTHICCCENNGPGNRNSGYEWQE